MMKTTFKWNDSLYFAALRPKDVEPTNPIKSLESKLQKNLKPYIDNKRIQIDVLDIPKVNPVSNEETRMPMKSVLYIKYSMIDKMNPPFNFELYPYTRIAKVEIGENTDIKSRQYAETFQEIYQIEYYRIQSPLTQVEANPHLLQQIPREDVKTISDILFIVGETIAKPAIPVFVKDDNYWLEHNKTIFTLGQMIRKHRDAGYRFLETHPDYIPKDYIKEEYYAWKTNQLNRKLLKEYEDEFDNVLPERYYKDINPGIIHV